MLTCREVAAKASLKVDGELGFLEKAAVYLHLMMCANCRRFARQFKTLVSGMAFPRNSATADIPPDFVNAVMGNLDSLREVSTHPPQQDNE